MVLVIGTLHLATLHQAKTPEEVKFVKQPIINARKPSVAASLHQALVKAEVDCLVPVEIFCFGCGIHRFHQRLQFLDLRAGEAAGCTSGREFLQGRIDINNIVYKIVDHPPAPSSPTVHWPWQLAVYPQSPNKRRAKLLLKPPATTRSATKPFTDIT